MKCNPEPIPETPKSLAKRAAKAHRKFKYKERLAKMTAEQKLKFAARIERRQKKRDARRARYARRMAAAARQRLEPLVVTERTTE